MHTVDAGQFITGRISASEELNIRPTTVRNKLNQLKEKKYIQLHTTNKFTIVTIKNWQTYQVEVSDNSKSDESLDNRTEKFTQEVSKFTEYDQNMLNDFIDYWTEPNKSKTKMRFEMQKTWSLSRRLSTWSKRSYKKTPVSGKKPTSKIAEGIDKWQKARQMIQQQNQNKNG